jgi:hypothetical protein
MLRQRPRDRYTSLISLALALATTVGGFGVSSSLPATGTRGQRELTARRRGHSCALRLFPLSICRRATWPSPGIQSGVAQPARVPGRRGRTHHAGAHGYTPATDRLARLMSNQTRRTSITAGQREPLTDGHAFTKRPHPPGQCSSAVTAVIGAPRTHIPDCRRQTAHQRTRNTAPPARDQRRRGARATRSSLPTRESSSRRRRV